MGSVHAFRLRDKSFWKVIGLASINIPPQLYFLSKSSEFDMYSPLRAPHSTKNPFVYQCGLMQIKHLLLQKSNNRETSMVATLFFKSLKMTPVWPGDRSLSSSESNFSGMFGGEGLFK